MITKKLNHVRYKKPSSWHLKNLKTHQLLSINSKKTSNPIDNIYRLTEF